MKTKITKYNFFKNNGYCILNLFNKNDIKQLKTKLSKKLNNTYNKNYFDNYNLKNYHKLINKKNLHNKIVDPNNRFIKLPKRINKKILNKELLFILKKEWGHNNCKTSWIGELKKKQVYSNSAGFRIARPKQKKDVAGVHIDLNAGGTLGTDIYSLAVIWIPIVGCSPKYALRISPKSHKINHTQSFKRKQGKISYVCNLNYEKKFKFLRPRLNIGQAILFHSNLLHGNSFNNGNLSRLSLDSKILNLKHFKKAVY